MPPQKIPYNAPPPGRARMPLDEVRHKWVEQFPNSQTRSKLWSNFEKYLARFAEIEQNFINNGWISNSESLLIYLWLGGSFISDKENPRNLDITLFLEGTVLEKMRGRPGSGWVSRDAFSRRTFEDTSSDFYGLTPIMVRYYPVKSIFHTTKFTESERKYIVDRGRWDDWLQRKRDVGVGEITDSSCRTRRGYVEVQV